MLLVSGRTIYTLHNCATEIEVSTTMGYTLTTGKWTVLLVNSPMQAVSNELL